MRASSRLKGEAAAQDEVSELALFTINGDCPRCGKVPCSPILCAQLTCPASVLKGPLKACIVELKVHNGAHWC